MPRPREIIRHIKEKLGRKESVVALVLVGSQAKNAPYRPDLYSDIEIYVVVQDGKVGEVEKKLNPLVNQLGRVLLSYKNQWAGPSFVFKDLRRLELPVVKQSDMKSVFSRPKPQVVKVLVDKTQGELEKVLEDRPDEIDYEKLFTDTILDFWYMTLGGVQYLKKGELWNARHLHQVLLAPKVALFLQLEEDEKLLLLERNKRIEQFLSEEKLTLLKKVSCEYGSEDVLMRVYQEAISIFDEYSDKIAQKHGFQKPAFVAEMRDRIGELLESDQKE